MFPTLRVVCITWLRVGRSLLSFAARVVGASYIGFYMLESLFPGFVSNYLNFSMLLYAPLGFLVLDAALPWRTGTVDGIVKRPVHSRWTLAGIALVIVSFVFLRLRVLGWVGPVVAVLGGLVIYAVFSLQSEADDLSISDRDRTLHS